MVEELRRCGVEIVTVADGFSLDGPAAEVILAVMAWAAKMERLATAERIAVARQRVEAEGGRWGRPRRMDDAQGQASSRAAQKRPQHSPVAEMLGVSKSIVGRALRGAERRRRKSVKYYLVYDGSTLVKVTDQVAGEAELFRYGKWVEANHWAAKVTGLGGGADADEVSEARARKPFPQAFAA